MIYIDIISPFEQFGPKRWVFAAKELHFSSPISFGWGGRGSRSLLGSAPTQLCSGTQIRGMSKSLLPLIAGLCGWHRDSLEGCLLLWHPQTVTQHCQHSRTVSRGSHMAGERRLFGIAAHLEAKYQFRLERVSTLLHSCTNGEFFQRPFCGTNLSGIWSDLEACLSFCQKITLISNLVPYFAGN